MTLDEIIARRRSVRRYEDTPVAQQALAAVLEAGRLAPSARNRQDWQVVVVKNPGLRQQLAGACHGQQMVAQAPVALVVWGGAGYTMPCGQDATSVDCSIMLSFMMLKATELGLGTCWLGAFDAEAVKELLGLGENAEVVAVTPLGTPAESPAPRPRKALGEIADMRE